MRVTAEELYSKLVDEYQIVGKSGNINFTLNGLSVLIKSKDSVGNLIQEWLKTWMNHESIEFEENDNSQTFPDFHLDLNNKKQGLLEVKTFDLDRGPGFDLANFDSYCTSLLSNAYRLDSDYLVFAYRMVDSEIKIENVWIKKIWQLAGSSGTYPLKVQEKKNVIYNIRPCIWYSDRNKFKPFETKELFLEALNETRYRYPQTRHSNAHWLSNVLTNYQSHTGVRLSVNM